ncbi:MAG: enoyl-CoA hydratase [Corynebacterium sp.]|nr:enoyl-CoA hydratase [Corynebacterium sp.]
MTGEIMGSTVTLTSTDQDLLVTRDKQVLILSLNRPDKRNALNAQLCRRITECVRELDNSVRAVLIRGEGSAFCAGADLGPTSSSAEQAQGGVYGGGFHAALHEMLAALVATPVPVIADVQGPAVGAGTQLSLACDLRLVGEKGWFAVPAAALGFALDAWTLNRARDLLGGAVARNMLIAHQRVSAQQAVTVGFAAQLCDADTALAFAHEVSSLAPLAMRHVKLVLNGCDHTYELSAAEQELYEQCWASEDAAEARLARQEKRKPKFHGR